MMNDQISDLFTRIRNAQRVGHKSVRVTSTVAGKRVLDVLREEGLIESYSALESTTAARELDVVLKYYPTGAPLISSAERVSRPGCRVYTSAGDIERVKSGLGIVIVSTSRGVLSDREARRLKVGGEVIARVG